MGCLCFSCGIASDDGRSTPSSLLMMPKQTTDVPQSFETGDENCGGDLVKHPSVSQFEPGDEDTRLRIGSSTPISLSNSLVYSPSSSLSAGIIRGSPVGRLASGQVRTPRLYYSFHELSAISDMHTLRDEQLCALGLQLLDVTLGWDNRVDGDSKVNPGWKTILDHGSQGEVQIGSLSVGKIRTSGSLVRVVKNDIEASPRRVIRTMKEGGLAILYPSSVSHEPLVSGAFMVTTQSPTRDHVHHHVVRSKSWCFDRSGRDATERDVPGDIFVMLARSVVSPKDGPSAEQSNRPFLTFSVCSVEGIHDSLSRIRLVQYTDFGGMCSCVGVGAKKQLYSNMWGVLSRLHDA